MDGWSNYYGTSAYYEAAKTLDEGGNLHMVLGLSYEFESSTDIGIEAEVARMLEGILPKNLVGKAYPMN